ncbi:hypothetical protein ELH77_19210 [Rhizobium ruizarguesonis]|uniref:hypothetical protein n=1 Tax=Rhizobium ruizarguesonis TaxID=2081791 RepID=UPI0010319B8E|nr:hypothetical protein [Rhizobium ruizarguesonis]TAZ20736.1 hypothetical protein ELH77_19210 [Rhizobium ruizarguesonis]
MTKTVTHSTLLRDTGEALYGPRWQSDIARDLDMSDRHVRRLASGAAELSPGMVEELLGICEERSVKLADVIRHLKKAVKAPVAE